MSIKFKFYKCFVLLVFFSWMISSLGVPPRAAAQTDAIEYRLGSGDEVRVTVFGQKELSGNFRVDGRGVISLPLVGNIEASGKTVRQIEESIKNSLKPEYLKNPSVSAEILKYRPFYIIGEVKNPGSYDYVVGINMMNAVAMAGGYTYRARENRLLVIRENDPKRIKEPMSPNAAVLPGDVIEVPERFF